MRAKCWAMEPGSLAVSTAEQLGYTLLSIKKCEDSLGYISVTYCMGLTSTTIKFGEIMQNNGDYDVQGHFSTN